MLQVSQLHVSYGQSEVICGVSFAARVKETLAIVGRNGMGKTTLFKALIGILPSRSGAITLDDQELSSEPSHKRVRRGLAYVPQGRMIFPRLSVEENIRTGIPKGDSAAATFDELYALFPVLFEMRKRRGGNLSGGQQQQLAIARALASNPSVLLLDEPTEGIQPSIIKDLAQQLNEIKRQRDIAIVVSEQVLSFTLAVADRVAVIEKGNLIHEANRADIDAEQLSRHLSV
ncbi:MAG: urea ABC transporter ATP-binding subunit UrtE [Pseudomonadota bacterium]|nr:urea ABC transporter ATP-binding subunit UrtE [Pseudomonadota bacterium]